MFLGEAQNQTAAKTKRKKLHVSIVTTTNRTTVVHIKDFPAGVSVCAKTAGGELDNEEKCSPGNVNNIQ